MPRAHAHYFSGGANNKCRQGLRCNAQHKKHRKKLLTAARYGAVQGGADDMLVKVQGTRHAHHLPSCGSKRWAIVGGVEDMLVLICPSHRSCGIENGAVTGGAEDMLGKPGIVCFAMHSIRSAVKHTHYAPSCGGRRWGSRGRCRGHPGGGYLGTAGTESTKRQIVPLAHSLPLRSVDTTPLPVCTASK